MQKIAVLIPCYNESVTIQKVVEDFKPSCQKRLSMCMTITLPITRMKSPNKRVL